MCEARSLSRLIVGRVVAQSEVGLGKTDQDHIPQRLASEGPVGAGCPDVLLEWNSERVVSFEGEEKSWNINSRRRPSHVDEICNATEPASCEPVIDQVAVHDPPPGQRILQARRGICDYRGE